MKVCIDAGHGGKDGGAQGASVPEKWIALDVANRVAQKLQNSGMSVVMTRDSDFYVGLVERANIANQTGADVFVSIHCNSGPSTAQGTEVWSYPGEVEDKRLAEHILGRMTARTGLHSRGTKEENFAVLRLTRCPAALVELGFISNVQEEQLMKTFDYQDQASTAIVEGIKQFMGIVEVQDVQELESVNDIVWELANRGIITDKGLWLDKLQKDADAYWLARKAVNHMRGM